MRHLRLLLCAAGLAFGACILSPIEDLPSGDDASGNNATGGAPDGAGGVVGAGSASTGTGGLTGTGGGGVLPGAGGNYDPNGDLGGAGGGGAGGEMP
jgi:hypothetical protein